MRYTISGRNVEVTSELRSAIESKLNKLEKYFQPDTEVNVTLSLQREQQKIEVTIPIKGRIIRAEESSTDMYVSLDLVEEVLERQIKKYRSKLVEKDKRQNSGAFTDSFINEDSDEEQHIEIVKTKRFAVKPMDPVDACVEMELLDHNFYVFLNSDTDQVNVVYKRKGNTYGLIEPEV